MKVEWILAGLTALTVIIVLVPVVDRYRLAPPPVLIIVCVYFATAAFGVLAYGIFDVPYLPIERDLHTIRLDFEMTSLQITTAAAWMLAGGMVAGIAKGQASSALDRRRSGSVRKGVVSYLGVVANVPSYVLIVCALIAIFAYIAGRGVNNLIEAPTYLASSGPESLEKLGFATGPIAVLAASIVASGLGTRSKLERVFGGAVLVLIVTVYFSAASRSLALVPVFIGGCLVLVSANGWKRIALAVGTGGATLLCLSLPIFCRSQNEHGLLPYISAVFDNPSRAFNVDLASVINNLLLGYPLANYVANVRMPPSALVTSLSPLPGGLSGFDNLSPALRVNYYVPYSALGELFSHGAIATAIYFSLTGLVFGFVWLTTERLAPIMEAVLCVTTLGLAGLFAIQSLQYNLRTVTRFEYYLLLIAAVLAIGSSIMRKARSTGDKFDAAS